MARPMKIVNVHYYTKFFMQPLTVEEPSNMKTLINFETQTKTTKNNCEVRYKITESGETFLALDALEDLDSYRVRICVTYAITTALELLFGNTDDVKLIVWLPKVLNYLKFTSHANRSTYYSQFIPDIKEIELVLK